MHFKYIQVPIHCVVLYCEVVLQGLAMVLLRKEVQIASAEKAMGGGVGIFSWERGRFPLPVHRCLHACMQYH